MKRDFSGFVQWSPPQQRRLFLWLCLVALLSITIFPQGTALGRYEQRPSYQASPLSPLATPLTATMTTTLPATQSLSITAPVTTPLTVTAGAAVTLPLTVPVTAPVTGQVTSPLTVPVTDVAATPVTPTATTAATATAVTTAVVVNQGQVSLLLVGAVLASILVVIAVVIGRRR